ncbi:MAG: cyclic nucleotide-binding domain-containing protein [Chloroflexi bacterium]|nr:cyclic nucleotide-binding domain-containing protein [Chloroflexota bacterium]
MEIGAVTAQKLLGECEVFSSLGNADLGRIASSVRESECQAGTLIFKEGQRAEELFVLLEGKVALQMGLPSALKEMKGGRRVTVDVIVKNELFGWSAIVEPNVYTLTAVCLQKSKTLSINGTKLRWLMQDNPKIGYEITKGLIKVIASRLNDTRQLLVSERLLAERIE